MNEQEIWAYVKAKTEKRVTELRSMNSEQRAQRHEDLRKLRNDAAIALRRMIYGSYYD